MGLELAFRDRIKDTRLYLKSLQDIETRLGTPGKTFYNAASTVNASRASVYIMMYNCVEFALTKAVSEIREEIQAGAYVFTELKEFWQNDFIQANFADRLRQGTNHADFTAELLKATKSVVQWKISSRNLPFSGNLDHIQIFKMRDQLGCKWQSPKGTIGGADLSIVRRRRNDLAHGEESFLNVGSGSNTAILIDQLDRIRNFVSSFLRMLERYQKRRDYLRR